MRGQRSGFGFSHGISVYVLLFQLFIRTTVFKTMHVQVNIFRVRVFVYITFLF